MEAAWRALRCKGPGGDVKPVSARGRVSAPTGAVPAPEGVKMAPPTHFHIQAERREDSAIPQSELEVRGVLDLTACFGCIVACPPLLPPLPLSPGAYC